MKKVLLGLFIAVLLPLQACAQVALFQEGTHFTTLDKPASKKPVVEEYFSFWCPACYRFEPLIKQLEDQLPADATLEKKHVNFMGFTSPQIQDYATTAMLVGKQLGKGEEVSEAIFNTIHVQGKGRALSSLEDFKNIAVANGIDAAEFDKVAKSFAVRSLLNKNNKRVTEYRGVINGVPNVIVNGKYVVNNTSVQSIDEYFQLVNFLLAKDS